MQKLLNTIAKLEDFNLKYFIDTEFDHDIFLSLALIREDGECIYIIHKSNIGWVRQDWIRKNVVSILYDVPSPMPGGMLYEAESDHQVKFRILDFLGYDPEPHVIADHPVDIKWLMHFIDNEDQDSQFDKVTTEVLPHINGYPTSLEGAVRHNAWWDAQAFRVAYDNHSNPSSSRNRS